MINNQVFNIVTKETRSLQKSYFTVFFNPKKIKVGTLRNWKIVLTQGGTKYQQTCRIKVDKKRNTLHFEVMNLYKEKQRFEDGEIFIQIFGSCQTDRYIYHTHRFATMLEPINWEFIEEENDYIG